MNVHPIRSRLGRAVVVVVAGSVVGITGALVVSADDRPSRPADYRDAIAQWAEANHVSGLSPASVSFVNRTVTADAVVAAEYSEYSEYRAIAEYARGAGLSGLSPASLSPVDD
jgi:hypothetical protein